LLGVLWGKKTFLTRKGQKYQARKIGIFFALRNNAGEKCVLLMETDFL